jgi:hypothetical protein
MNTIAHHIRNHLLESLGVPCGPVRRLPPLEALRATQWSEQFERLRSNRMVFGAFRYGPIAEQRRGKPYDNVGSAIKRLELYRETGNQEHLVDVANICMVEFETGKHTAKHFQASDDDSGTHILPK